MTGNLRDKLLINSIVVFVAVELVQLALYYTGTYLIDWFDKVNGKHINITLEYRRRVIYQKKLSKISLLSIAASLKKCSLSFVILAVVIPCCTVVSFFGDSDMKEGERECLILIITSMGLIFRTEVMFNGGSGRVRSSYESVLAVFCIWTFSIMYLHSLDLRAFKSPRDLNEKTMIKNEISFDQFWFLLKYCCLFIPTGVLRKPIYSSKKTQLFATIFWSFWVTTFFFYLLNIQDLENEIFPENDKHGALFLIYLAICKWRGRYFIYLMFLQATILHHSYIQIDDTSEELRYSCAVKSTISNDVLKRILYAEGKESIDYESIGERRISELELWEQPEYERLTDYNLDSLWYDTDEVLEEISIIHGKLREIYESKREQYGFYYLSTTSKILSKSFFKYHMKRLKIIYNILAYNNCCSECAWGSFDRNETFTDLKENLEKFRGFIDKEVLLDDFESDRLQEFKKCSNQISKNIWELSKAGLDMKMTKRILICKFDFIFSCMNQPGLFLEYFYVESAYFNWRHSKIELVRIAIFLFTVYGTVL